MYTLLQHPLAFLSCSPAAFPSFRVPGAEIQSLSASYVSNVSKQVPEALYLNHGSVTVSNASFCNVSVSYVHPPNNNSITVSAWLPTAWNHRMQGLGGGGWSAGVYAQSTMVAAMGEGYIAVTTDGGRNTPDPLDSTWAIPGPGQVDLDLLEEFASISLNDASIIGKSLAKSYYGLKPNYSYFSGCSQGGRQGLMLAQRYPTAYDGIVASAPAIYWSENFVGGYYPQFVMNQIGEYPHPCELNALTSAAIAACDGNDGVEDGIISNPDACNFSPYTHVGVTFNCTNTGTIMHISRVAAAVAQAAWTGFLYESGKHSPVWVGLTHEAPLTGPLALANTQCPTSNSTTTCTGSPLSTLTDWIRLFVLRSPTFPLSTLSHSEYIRLFHDSIREYGPILDTSSANLSAFRARGGKLLSYHGLADSIIPSRSTRRYYDKVAESDPDVRTFYRLFESPGLGHCYGGRGGYPAGIFDALVDWVEYGSAPDHLDIPEGKILCPHPQRPIVGEAGKFSCGM